jgi:DNA primase
MMNTSLDLVSLIEQYSGIRLIHRATTGNGEYWGMCPFCNTGDNRFHVWPASARPHYWCRVCYASGDAIQFLKDYSNMSYVEACEALGVEPDHAGWDGGQAEQSLESPPPKKWREVAALFVERAVRYLWHPKSLEGQKALAYLRARGFTDETIKRVRLGCVPLGKDGRWYSDEFEAWGLDPADLTPEQLKKGCLRIPNGILIPWFYGGEVWKLAVKRPGDPKMDYGQVLGSVEALYNVDSIQYDQPCMMVEGEFDCMSIEQEAGDLVACVATGSTTRARLGRWIAELAMASYVIQGYDDDQAGEDGAAYWLNVLKNCIRFQPCFYKDPNDMLQNLSPEELRNWVLWGMHAWEYGQYLDSLPEYVLTLAREEEPLQTSPQVIHKEDEKRIVMLDGIRMSVGYSRDELIEMWVDEIREEQQMRNYWTK